MQNVNIPGWVLGSVCQWRGNEYMKISCMRNLQIWQRSCDSC